MLFMVLLLAFFLLAALIFWLAGLRFGCGGGFDADHLRPGGLQTEHAADHAHADIRKKVLEGVGGLALVLHQGVHLGVSFHADGDAQCFHTGELFDPQV